MIQETIVTTLSSAGKPHIAPMGIHVEPDFRFILPFRPSVTLDNILATGQAVLSHTDDVRVFAGCITGRNDWGLLPSLVVAVPYLADCLTHQELELIDMEDDPVRPRLRCRVVQSFQHKPFQGFNRAQFAVIEAAILITRLGRLPWEKVQRELEYLRIGLDKCAGSRELEAWDWLMEKLDSFRLQTQAKESEL